MDLDWTFVALGALGGVLPDVLRIIKSSRENVAAAYLRRIEFYLGLVGAILVGGLVAWLLQASKPLEAIAYGFSGPAILTKLISKADGQAGDSGGEMIGSVAEAKRFSLPLLRSWWVR